MMRYPICCFLLLTCLSSQAAIIECKQENGDIIYTDKPCDGGDSRVIREFDETKSSFSASGTFMRNGKTFNIATGIAYWVSQNRELSIILLPDGDGTESLAREVEQLRLHAFANENAPNYVHITFELNEGMMGLSAISHMRTVLLGMEERNKTEWAITFPDIRLHGKLVNFKIFRTPGLNEIRYESEFTNDNISWNYKIKLHIQDERF